LVIEGRSLHFCHEAGPCGYGLYRQIVDAGHACTVVAPSSIPCKPGERVKTDRLDAMKLARLLRAGDVTAVWVPDAPREAMRDLVRSRADAIQHLKASKCQLLA
jgi:transposase